MLGMEPNVFCFAITGIRYLEVCMLHNLVQPLRENNKQ